MSISSIRARQNETYQNPTPQQDSSKTDQKPKELNLNLSGLKEGDKFEVQVKGGTVQVLNLNKETPDTEPQNTESKNTDGFWVRNGKGLLGAAAATATAAGMGAFFSAGMIGVYGDLTLSSAATGAGVIGAISGGVAGLVAANVSDNRAVATTTGVVVGAIVSTVAGGGFLIGGVAGGVGGYTAASLIK